jgi:predicted amidophosphoribosyltransferase
VIAALLDFIYGERCAQCAASRAICAWTTAGPRVSGLRPWDAPHLCAACAAGLAGAFVVARLSGASASTPPIYAARREDAALVKLVGEFKYRGLRGLGWPLGRLMGPAAASAMAIAGPVDALVAMPLHPRRRRARGFNQADVLAQVVAWDLGLPVLTGCLRRCRATSQQAALAAGDTDRRCGNVAGAFVADAPSSGQLARVALVDDLITTGATWAAAESALAGAGWEVRWGLALGVAARLADPAALDTVGAGL